MANNKYPQCLATVAVALSLELSILPFFATQVQAQVEPVNSGSQQSLRDVVQIRFKSPPGQGEPKQSGTTGSRGKCYQDKDQRSSSLTPLLPSTNQGLTMAERPTFFVYVPPTLAQIAEFVLIDRTDKNKPREVYYKTFSLPQVSGIVSVKLPTEQPPLEIGRDYQWSFTLFCDSDERSDDISVYGWVKRTAPNLAVSNALENAKPLERAALYGEYGMWQELLTTLADLRRSQPENSTLASIWNQLLKSESVKLDKISQEPLVDCCSL
ncbi:MAG TPA: hypothetical protein DDZ80_18830 [Cyanobacteria bacterium UBA8803]|nr:hypothetical protein [Cyanobacteria bacterium UBA9273]HBL60432.1 hypothetical protein [Cyanobacteria bacterium UBA8803]